MREVNFKPRSRNKGFVNRKGSPLKLVAILNGVSKEAVAKHIKNSAKYAEKVAAAAAFNHQGGHLRRGVGISSNKYFVLRGQMGMKCRVDVLSDGTIQIDTGGCEMGQGLHTKVGQTACSVLSRRLGVHVSEELVSFRDQGSASLPMQPGTGGATGSEITCFATDDACRIMAKRLKPWQKKAENPKDWKSIVAAAYKGAFPIWSFDCSATGRWMPKFKNFL